MALNKRKFFSLAAILILSLFPLWPWLLMLPWATRFSDLGATMTSLGQIAGLIGLSLFSVNLILSVRLRILDNFFSGLDKVYHFHRWVGTISFSLLLFHPLFLVARYLEFSLLSALQFILPSSNWPQNFGLISLLLMIVFIALTIYGTLKYQNWKLSHKFMVLVFAFALLHSFLIGSDISRDAILRGYLLTLGLIALAAGFYQAFLSRFINNDAVYTLKNINRLNPKVFDLELEADKRPLRFRAGQFVFVKFLGGQVKPESHPFSLSSAPDSQNLRITIKSLGDFTSTLVNLKAGVKTVIEGPYGRFFYESADNRKQIWIAGGVGITPFLSMVRDLKTKDYEIDLYYCANNQAEAVAVAELQEIARGNKNFKLITWYSADQGRISAAAIHDLSGGLRGKDIFLCGPASFMFGLREQLKNLQVAGKNIHLENFKFL